MSATTVREAVDQLNTENQQAAARTIAAHVVRLDRALQALAAAQRSLQTTRDAMLEMSAEPENVTKASAAMLAHHRLLSMLDPDATNTLAASTLSGRLVSSANAHGVASLSG